MPELPEVETMRRGLNDLVVGEIIDAVEVYWPRIIESPEVSEFVKRLEGQEIEKVDRRGKFILFYLTDDVLISHLRMEGKYRLLQSSTIGQKKEKHTHVIFDFKSGKELHYSDVRKFGRMSLVPKGEEFSHKSLKKLGPEPVKEEFLFKPMQEFLKRRRKTIKAVLLDQEVVVGIGNIYADEILFQAKIHPETPANELTEQQEKDLYQAILTIMEKAVEKGGTTIRSYENAFSKPGAYQNFLKVYGKEDEKCSVCGIKINKIRVAGRGTHFCPHCQPLKDGDNE